MFDGFVGSIGDESLRLAQSRNCRAHLVEILDFKCRLSLGRSREVRSKDQLGLLRRVAHAGRQQAITQCDTLLKPHLESTCGYWERLLLQIRQ